MSEHANVRRTAQAIPLGAPTEGEPMTLPKSALPDLITTVNGHIRFMHMLMKSADETEDYSTMSPGEFLEMWIHSYERVRNEWQHQLDESNTIDIAARDPE